MAAAIGLLLAAIIGVAPMVVYALVLWWFDRYEKEPLALLAAAFLWGAIPAVIFSLIAELVLGIPISQLIQPAAASLLNAAVIAPVAEEVFKGGALVLLFLFFRREIDGALDGILYGGLVGFGFAAVENTLYFGAAVVQEGLGALAALAMFRAVLFGLNHALFTGLFGLGIAWGYTASNKLVKVGAPLAGLVAGVTSHAIHNASVTLGGELGWPCLVAFASDWGGVAFVLGVLVWASVREQRWIERWLGDEVERGTLSRRDYEVISSYTARVAERTAALLRGDFERWRRLGHYYRLATELAFNRRHLSRSGEAGAEQRVERLRSEVVDLKQET
jgi:RsiW-degrading membrane proteinase PrsW (M82 family)